MFIKQKSKNWTNYQSSLYLSCCYGLDPQMLLLLSALNTLLTHAHRWLYQKSLLKIASFFGCVLHIGTAFFSAFYTSACNTRDFRLI